MGTGEFLTRLTIWIVLAGYAIGTVLFALARKRPKWESVARLAWTVACVSLLAHVGSAFHFYHGWSEETAYRETARQTAAVVGINWGGGIYINYAVVLFWILDVTWWWRGLDVYRRRPTFLVVLWQAFLIFMIFNATVVFKTGPLRWIGLSICLALACFWLHSWKQGPRRVGQE
jgi:hypothetical protein